MAERAKRKSIRQMTPRMSTCSWQMRCFVDDGIVSVMMLDKQNEFVFNFDPEEAYDFAQTILRCYDTINGI